MVNTRLSDIFHITERFQRSVHLERDFYTENALEGLYCNCQSARDSYPSDLSTRERSDLESLVPHRSLRVRKISIRAFRCKIVRGYGCSDNTTSFGTATVWRYVFI